MNKMDKGCLIKDIANNDVVEGVFCVSQKRELLTRHNKPYLALRLMDSTGEMEARVWENAKEASSRFDYGDIVEVKAKAADFRGSLQLSVSKIIRLDGSSVDLSFFMPASKIPLNSMLEEFERILDTINRQELRSVLNVLFNDHEFLQDFTTAPAAKGMHHAWIHGLLEHTLSVTRLADAVCAIYPELDRDLMIAGALCHDMGKCKELSFRVPPIDYSVEGRLFGHITIGVSILEKATQKAGVEPEHHDICALKHIILSHHGEKEFGSPVLPMTQEAVMLHMIDNIDAKMNYITNLKDRFADSDEEWSDYQNMFSRYFYLNPARNKDRVDVMKTSE